MYNDSPIADGGKDRDVDADSPPEGVHSEVLASWVVVSGDTKTRYDSDVVDDRATKSSGWGRVPDESVANVAVEV